MTAALGGGQLALSALGYFQGRGRRKRAEQQEQQATTAQQGIATDFTGFGRNFLRQAQPGFDRAQSYFTRLATGDRATMGAELAPDISAINDVYSGAARSMSRFLRGPEKDVQTAELERERTGKIASLFRDARPNAVARLLDFSTGQANMGTGLLRSSASIYGGIADRATMNRLGAEQDEADAGEAFGTTLSDLFRFYGGGGGRRNLRSRQTVPNFTSWMPS